MDAQAAAPQVLQIRSADGSEIGCEVVGEGPPLLLVHGATADRGRWGSVREALAARFRLHLMDRRGRGLSVREGQGAYAIEREGEDVAALLDAIGEPALVLGHSYGGACALLAAADGAEIERLLVYEPAFGGDEDPVFPTEALAEVDAALSRGDREAALTAFFSGVLLLGDDAIAAIRATPVWAARLAAAYTLPREARAANALRLDAERLAPITAPTRFLLGTETTAPLDRCTRAAHAALPGSDLRILAGHGHTAMDADPELFVAEVVDWLGPGAGRA